MEHRIISADGHIDLRHMPHDVFTSNAPAKWKDRVPHVIETKEGTHWFAEGIDLVSRPHGDGGMADATPVKHGLSKHMDRMLEMGYYEGGLHPSTPELRIRDQEIDGVDAEVIYGVLAMGRVLEDRELIRWVYETYNTWAADFCRTAPGRLVALACIPNDDPEIAAGELRRAAKLGLKAADFTAKTAVMPLWHRDWDPLWAAADECNIPISFHGISPEWVRKPSDEQMAKEYRSRYIATLLTMFQIAGAEFLASICFSGALERYPGLKFVMAESGVGWIPYILNRMDEEYEDRFSDLNLSLKPSEYWRRQGYTTFQHEVNLLDDVVRLVGEDNIMWGSDYPHEDGVWPDSQKWIKQDLGHLDEKVQRKITCENAGKLYGFLK